MRKRPTPDTPIAKLHSWVFSNSSRCIGVITLRTRSRLCCGVSGFCVIGAILPLTFIDGGMPAVMNRSDAFWCAISLRNEVKSMLLMSYLRNSSDDVTRAGEPALGPPSLEQTLVLRIFLGVRPGDHAALHQVLQVLV